MGRFYDLVEKRGSRWAVVLRQQIYETVWVNAVVPGEALVLDTVILNSYPVGYRHLAYLQVGLGLPVKKACPVLSGLKSTRCMRGARPGWQNREHAPVVTGRHR